MKMIAIILMMIIWFFHGLQGQIPGIGLSTYTGIINAYRFPGTNVFSSIPFPQAQIFTIFSIKATGYNGLRRLRGIAYLGNNTDDFEDNDTQKFMQLRLIDHLVPDHNSARIGWRYTRRPPLNVPQYELGLYAHINHLTNTNHGREGHTFGLPTYEKFKLFEYSLIVGRSYGMAARIQYQGIDSTVWIVRTLEDWQSAGFTLTDAEASLYAKKGGSTTPNPLYINAFSSSVITPTYSNTKFWHRNVGMMDTWVKAGEIKVVTARNYINLILESFLMNPANSTHPNLPNGKTPYLKVDKGGALFVECKNGIDAYIRPGLANPFGYRQIEVSHGGIAKFVIIQGP
jgi:hypothetical protein